jgi:CRP-like cAMP-binding protein
MDLCALVHRSKGGSCGEASQLTGSIPKPFSPRIGAGKTILKFEKNQRVFEQGEVADTVFYIQKGSVKLTVLSEQGKEAVVGIIEPGQFFGEGCPVMESTRGG